MVTIVLTEPGSKIQVKKDRFLFTHGFSTKPASEVPFDIVDHIISETSCTITAQAMAAFASHSIPLVWIGPSNRGLYILPSFQNGLAELRKKQYEAISSAHGVSIAYQIVMQVAKNRLNTLSKWHKSFDVDLSAHTKKIKEYLKHPPNKAQTIESCRADFMAFEAKIAKEYWNGFAKIIQHFGYNFSTRSKRPAKDPLNALLNYGYAILESQIVASITITGLDIYAGFLHSDRSGRFSLVQDLKEEFRQVLVDEALVQFVKMHNPTEDDFVTKGDEIQIGNDIKKLWVQSLFHRLEAEFGKHTLRRHIILQGRTLANCLMGKRKRYSPFANRVKYP